MGTPLILKLITAASSYAPLSGVGISSYPKPQNAPLPWIVLQTISNPQKYTNNSRIATSWARIQATIFGGGVDQSACDAVETAWASFLDQFIGDGDGPREIAPNTIVNSRDGGIVSTQPMTFQRFVDAMIRNDETI